MDSEDGSNAKDPEHTEAPSLTDVGAALTEGLIPEVPGFRSVGVEATNDAVLLIVTSCGYVGQEERWKYELHSSSGDGALCRDEIGIPIPVGAGKIMDAAADLYDSDQFTLHFTAISPELGYATAYVKHGNRKMRR